MKNKFTKMPSDRCPVCNHYFNVATQLIEYDDGTPSVGDFTICIECASILKYNSELKTELTTANELRELSKNDHITFLDLNRARKVVIKVMKASTA